MTRHTLLPQSILMLVSAIVGFLLVTQLRTQDTITQDVRNLPTDELIHLISTTADDNLQTRQEIAKLQNEIDKFQRDQTQGKSALAQLAKELAELRAVTGGVEVEGPGVIVSVYYDLRAVNLLELVNEVRNAGAEALALNDQRIVARSPISEANGQVLVNGIPVSKPFRIKAIGDPETLTGALTRIGGPLRFWRDGYNVPFDVQQAENIVLPRYNGPVGFRHAEPAP